MPIEKKTSQGADVAENARLALLFSFISLPPRLCAWCAAATLLPPRQIADPASSRFLLVPPTNTCSRRKIEELPSICFFVAPPRSSFFFGSSPEFFLAPIRISFPVALLRALVLRAEISPKSRQSPTFKFLFPRYVVMSLFSISTKSLLVFLLGLVVLCLFFFINPRLFVVFINTRMRLEVYI